MFIIQLNVCSFGKFSFYLAGNGKGMHWIFNTPVDKENPNVSWTFITTKW